MDRWRQAAIAAVIALSLCVVGGLALIATGNVSAETDEPGPVYGSGDSPYGGMSVHYDDLEDGAVYHVVRYGMVHISFSGTDAKGMESDLAGSGLITDYGNESIDGELIHSCIVTIGDKTISLIVATGTYGDLPIYGIDTEITLDALETAYYGMSYSYKFLVEEDVIDSLLVTPFTVTTDISSLGLSASFTWEGTGRYATSGEYCDIYCTMYGTPTTPGTFDIEIAQDSGNALSANYFYNTSLTVIDYYTINFDCDGGNVDGVETFSETVTYGDSITLPDPKKADGENAVCEGWYVAKAGGGLRVGDPGTPVYPHSLWDLNESIALYANWVSTTNPVTEMVVDPSTELTVAVGSTTYVSITCNLQDPNGYVRDDSCDVIWTPVSGEEYVDWNPQTIAGVGAECYITGVSPGTFVVTVRPANATTDLSQNITITVVEVGGVTTYNYLIRYHYNDGTTNSWTESFQYTATSYNAYILSSKIPDRDGYTFLGWAKTSSATEPDFRKENLAVTGALVQAETDNNFYAVWQKDSVQWTLKFEAAGVTANPTDMTAMDDGDYHIFSPLPTLTDTDTHEFLGWAKSSAATVPAYGGGGQYKAWTTSETLYAVWGEISATHDFRLEYETYGGTAVAATEFLDKTESSWSTTVSNTKPTKTGYEFLGWALTPGAGVSKNPGDEITLYPGTQVLYAVWSQEDFVLTLKGNGGTPDTDEITVLGEGSASLILTDEHKPTYEGHIFQGWADQPDESPYMFVGSTVYFTTEDPSITLYAIWMEGPDVEVGEKEYTIRFDPQNGADVVTRTFKESQIPFTIPDLSLEKVGHTFEGWSDRSDGTVAIWHHGVTGIDTYTPTSDEPKTIYAIWKVASDTWTVKLNLHGGYGGPGDIHEPNVPDGTTSWNIEIPGPEPKKHGYVFLGWGLTENDADPIDAGGTYVATQKVSELHALWDVDPNQWILLFDANGGTGAPVVDGSYPLDGECEFTVPNKAPSRDGFRFLGWWTEKTEPGEITTTDNLIQAGPYTTTTNEVTLYAVWSEGVPGQATLIFNLMGGTYTGTGLDLEPVSCTTSHEFDIPDVTPTKEGYVFLGWADKSGSKTADYIIGGEKRIPVDSGKTKMVYAVWIAESESPSSGSDDGGWGLGTYIAIIAIAILALFIILRFAGVA